jgi:hypothetical protein
MDNPWRTIEREAELAQDALRCGNITLEEAQDKTFDLLRVIAAQLAERIGGLTVHGSASSPDDEPEGGA